MANKYLDYNGLIYLWSKIKAAFVSDVSYDSTNSKITKTKNGSTTDVVGLASTASAGLMSANDKNTLENIVTTGGEPNQNAWSNISVGGNTLQADSKTDTFSIVAGDNVTLTSTTSSDSFTISAVDTTYNPATTTTDGLLSSTDKIKLDGIASGAEVNQNAFSNVKVGNSTIAADGKTDTLTLEAGTGVTLTPDTTNDKVTISSIGTTYSLVGSQGTTGLVKNGSSVSSTTNYTATPIVDGIPYYKDTTYTAGTTANLNTGTSTTSMVYTPKVLHDYIAVSTAAAVEASTFSKKIDGVTFDGTSDIIHYGECSTDNTSTTKIVACSGFNLTAGSIIWVKFTATLPQISGSSNNIYLNVNDTGAKTIKYKYGTNVTSQAQFGGDRVHAFIYDGSYYQLLTGIDTTYTAGTTANLDTGTSTTSMVYTPKVLHDYIENTIATAQIGGASFQGTVSAATDISSLTDYKTGWYWVVSTAGTYVGQVCEVGDMIFCVSDYNSSYSTSDFTVVQNNMDIASITNGEIDTIVAS